MRAGRSCRRRPCTKYEAWLRRCCQSTAGPGLQCSAAPPSSPLPPLLATSPSRTTRTHRANMPPRVPSPDRVAPHSDEAHEHVPRAVDEMPLITVAHGASASMDAERARAALRLSDGRGQQIKVDAAAAKVGRRRQRDAEAECRSIGVQLQLALCGCVVASIANQEEVVHLLGFATEREAFSQQREDASLDGAEIFASAGTADSCTSSVGKYACLPVLQALAPLATRTMLLHSATVKSSGSTCIRASTWRWNCSAM